MFRSILQSSNIKLFVSLIAQKGEDKYSEPPLIKLNFGATEFAFNSKNGTAHSLDDILKKTIPQAPVITNIRTLEMQEPSPSFVAHIKLPVIKSFSNFPPTVHRKSLCASIIQRAWKRHRGKTIREKLRIVYNTAAIVIQTVFRKKLSILMAQKNQAAKLIQRNWRIKLFIHAAVFRATYGRPLKVLHRAATIVQVEWRRHYLFKTSPFAVKYGKSLDGILFMLFYFYFY